MLKDALPSCIADNFKIIYKKTICFKNKMAWAPEGEITPKSRSDQWSDQKVRSDRGFVVRRGRRKTNIGAKLIFKAEIKVRESHSGES